MRATVKLGLALVLLGTTWSTGEAHWSVGVGVGYGGWGPYRGWGPGWGYGYRPYYYPRVGVGLYAPYYPAYVPPPVVVAPPPVVVQSPAPAQPVYTAAPAPIAASVSASPPQEVTQAVANAPVLPSQQANVSAWITQLRSPQEQEGVNALTQLGRMKAEESVSPIIRVLSEDSSSRARDAAARALGLIGSEYALPALQRAALDDNDRDVRHSASYAAEVIRSSLQRPSR